MFHATTERCFHVASTELGSGTNTLTSRFTPARNGQLRGVRMAADYLEC